MPGGISRDEAKNWWLRCISCSETSVTLVNRSAGVEAPLLEQALHLFSGGFMHEGHACGHLWGAALSAGIQATERFGGGDASSVAALDATCRLVDAMSEDGWAFNCRQNTGYDFKTLGGRLNYLRSDKPKACGRKALAWASQANAVIDATLAGFNQEAVATPCENCAVNCMSKLGSVTGLEKDKSAFVAGFAGGLGLTGNICGVLSVGVFALSLRHYQVRNPDKRDTALRAGLQELNLVPFGLRKFPRRLREDFQARFGSMHCSSIADRKFENIDDHSQYIAEGGCQEVIHFVIDWLQERVGVLQEE